MLLAALAVVIVPGALHAGNSGAPPPGTADDDPQILVVPDSIRVTCTSAAGAAVASAGVIADVSLFTQDTAVRSEADERAGVRLGVSTAALDALANTQGAIRLRDVPIGGGALGDFVVERVDVFKPDASIVAIHGAESTRLPLPNVQTFAGVCERDPQSDIAVAVSGAGEVRAMVRTPSGTSFIGPEAAGAPGGEHRFVEMADVSTPAAEPYCSADALAPNLDAFGTFERSLAGVTTASSERLQAEVVVDVDNTLYTGPFASSPTTTSTYVASLFSAISNIYRRDVNVCLKIKELAIWTTPDPFQGADAYTQLQEYRNYNVANRPNLDRALCHLLAGDGYGGIAWTNTLCDKNLEYSVGNIHADVTFPVTGYVWDVDVSAHEMGHSFGSVHTHCYDPPIDCCYATEAGCPCSPQEWIEGTIMSYCHFGPYKKRLEFHERVKAVLRTRAEAAVCLNPGCNEDCPNGVFWIDNRGTAPLSVTSIEVPSWLSLSPSAPPTIQITPGETRAICVNPTCSACSGVNLNGTIVVHSNDPTTPDVSLPVTLVCPCVPPDFDCDHDVDLTDFMFLQTCFNGPSRPPAVLIPACLLADFDHDGDIDMSDFSAFLACFNGPNRPPPVGCFPG